MSEYDRALADIAAIRSGMAAGTVFRGFGPAALLATSGIALAVALLQTVAPPTSAGFFAGWIAAAVLSALVVGTEAVVRSRRDHGGLADAMILQAAQQFVPSGIAGAAFAAFVSKFCPENAWMVPGVWQVLVGLGVFAAVRSLPTGAGAAAGWYVVSGFAVLVASVGSGTPSPWAMALPFVVGQAILAWTVHRLPETTR